jgi:ligand-binding sensor domain-containing protein/membrane-bound lytic murein transglycosylase MltF
MTLPWFRKTLALSLLLLLAPGMDGRSLQEIRQSGKLYVAFTEWDYRNINYPLALEFARYLNVKLIDVPIRWDEAFSRNGEIPPGLETDPDLTYTPDALKKADIICSTFSTVEWRKKLFDFAETLYSSELLITSSSNQLPLDYEGLKGKKIAFMSGTTFEPHITEINRELGGGILLTPVQTDEDSKRLLLHGEVYGIILDADEALNFNAQNNNHFQIVFPVSPLTRSAWAVEKNNSLRNEIEEFFETISVNGTLDKIFYDKFQLRYSSYVNRIRKNSRLEILHRDLDEILSSKKLVVALRERNFIYKEGEHKQFMHALAGEFAKYLGVKLDFIITPNSARYWENGEGKIVKDSSYTPEWFNHFDLACEIFAPAEWRTNKVNEVSIFPTEYVVVARKKTNLNSMEDLSGFEGVTASGTVYEDMLQKRNIHSFHYAEVDQFLEEVNSGKADYAIIMNAFFELSTYPDLEPKFSVGETEICWALRKDQPELEKKLQQFLAESRKNGLIGVLDRALRGNGANTPDDDQAANYSGDAHTSQFPYILYGTADGLPQEDVFSILQDSRGRMWFGTKAGVTRYNGREMLLINGSESLRRNSVLGMAEDSSGRIYLATSSGVAVLQNDALSQVYCRDESFSAVYVDPLQQKWLTGNHALYLINSKDQVINFSEKFPVINGTITSVCYSPALAGWFLAGPSGVFFCQKEEISPEKVCDLACFSLASDVNDSLWLSMRDGIYLIAAGDMKNKKFQAVARKLNTTLGIPNIPFKEILHSRYGTAWFVSDYRLFQVVSANQKAIEFEQEIGLKNNTIHTVMEDAEDNLWIGFSGGLQRISNRRGIKNFFPNILNSGLYSLVEDKTGRIWMTSNKGIFYYQKRLVDASGLTGLEKKISIAGKLPDGNLVLANETSLVMLNPVNLRIIRRFSFPEPLKGIEKLSISSKGELFFLTGTENKIYYLRHPGAKPISFSNRATGSVHCLLEYNGEIIGGNNFGLISFNGLEFRQSHELGLDVWALCSDDGKLWLGTDEGLKTFENNKLLDVSPANIPSKLIKSIMPARNQSYLWLGTSRGFSYFNIQTLTEEFSISSKDGLSGDEVTAGGLLIDSQGLLWISTNRGLSSFNIRIASVRNYSPVCYIERMVINGKDIPPGSRNKFPHDQNNFQFEISALSFSDEQSIEYEFILRGTGNGYSSASRGKEYKTSFTGIPPGKYELLYKAKGKNGIWGSAQKYEFVVRKAWYETWLFRITAILCCVSITWIYFRHKLQNYKTQFKNLQEQLRIQSGQNQQLSEKSDILENRISEQDNRSVAAEKQHREHSQKIAQLQQKIRISKEKLLQSFSDYFVLHKPAGSLGGDFIWTAGNEQKILLVTATCHGNGLSAEYLSLLLDNILNEINHQEKLSTAGRFLEIFRTALHTYQLPESNDLDPFCIDIGLCLVDPVEMKLQFAGAGNSISWIRKSKMNVFRGDPVHFSNAGQAKDLTNHVLELEVNDQVYLLTEGYACQTGGLEKKKFGSESLHNFLLEIQHLSMRQQQQMLSDRFEKWKAGIVQENDVTVIGIRI